VRWYGCRRGANLRRESHRGERGSGGESRDRPANAVNPMTGTGVQQTRSPSPEQAVEAVQNREDGTWSTLVGSARSRARERTAGVDGGGDVGGGVRNRRRGVTGANRWPAWTEGLRRSGKGRGCGPDSETKRAPCSGRDPRSRRNGKVGAVKAIRAAAAGRTRKRHPRSVRRSGSCSPQGETSPGT
jgi:hypothetical protein